MLGTLGAERRPPWSRFLPGSCSATTPREDYQCSSSQKTLGSKILTGSPRGPRSPFSPWEPFSPLLPSRPASPCMEKKFGGVSEGVCCQQTAQSFALGSWRLGVAVFLYFRVREGPGEMGQESDYLLSKPLHGVQEADGELHIPKQSDVRGSTELHSALKAWLCLSGGTI